MSNGFHLLHITFYDFVATPEIMGALERTFNSAADWLRYDEKCWLLWTNRSPEDWKERIAQTPGLPTGFGVLILTVQRGIENRSGFAHRIIWDFFKRH
jgi:hypothetical protein